MNTDREAAEYRTLCIALESLQKKYLQRKKELRLLLEKTFALKRDAFQVLAKANRLTRYLTGRQRQTAGLSYHLNEIKARINQSVPVVFQSPDSIETEEPEALLKTGGEQTAGNQTADRKSVRELKQKGFAVLKMIDSIRKNLLQLDLLEMRCRELIIAIDKALSAFRHEFRNIRRKIYPFGFFSFFYRSLRSLSGGSYFVPRDMEDVSALGNLTGHVLKIADSPII